ncbi:MAG: hypothetical protein VX667_05735 [Nitrospinota bacterium]|nr:hypothetical protein [Nitrospinota bacterium]
MGKPGFFTAFKIIVGCSFPVIATASLRNGKQSTPRRRSKKSEHFQKALIIGDVSFANIPTEGGE